MMAQHFYGVLTFTYIIPGGLGMAITYMMRWCVHLIQDLGV